LTPTFKRGRNVIANARDEVAALREKIKPPQPDKTDSVIAGLSRLWLVSMRSGPTSDRTCPNAGPRCVIGSRLTP